MVQILSFQPELSQRLPEVVGNVDYQVFRSILERIDDLIRLGDLEKPFIEYRLRQASLQLGSGEGLGAKGIQRLIEKSREGFRCMIIFKLLKLSFRKLAERLADSPLLQRFCLLSRLDKIRVPSKSQLERYEKMFPLDLINEVMDQLTRLAKAPLTENDPQALGLEECVSMNAIYVDATCVEGNIHYPVDWVLLRDATRTLMKSVSLIRRTGLKNRMDDPSTFIRSMNKLCIAMTHSKNRRTQKREKKRIYRLMKKLMKKIGAHAVRHRDLLKAYGQGVGMSEGAIKQILRRINNVLEKLPKAIHQAQERILGERQVKNKEKLLSFYEEDLHVCYRGKAGVPVEFGNTLVISEQSNGLIVDWKLYREQAPGDPKLLKESLNRISTRFTPKTITTDRGMCSKNNKDFLEKNKIENMMCPRSPLELSKKLQENDFCFHQKRRAQTEGRIGILKNQFLGNPLRNKGFENREKALAWAILSHNLWVIARMPQKKSKTLKKAA